MTKEIGGYFELELIASYEYHQDAIRLNTGRNCLEYILRAKKYRKIYLPYYTCEVLFEPIHKLGLECDFYQIDGDLTPIFDKSLKADDVLLYINYFGLKNDIVKNLSKKYLNLIIDNAQGFFAKPVKGVNTFYSARKFFGVPDGAYLYINKKMSGKLEKEVSNTRFTHLIKRIDSSAETGYTDFKNNESSFIDQPMKLMSELTQRLLSSIDYTIVAQKRKRNFNYLHSKLKSTNRLALNVDDETVPMVYPYMTPKGNKLKKKLISQKIYVATYWPNVLETCKKNSFEYELADKTLFLPIDQRYGIEEMNYVYEKIMGLMS